MNNKQSTIIHRLLRINSRWASAFISLVFCSSIGMLYFASLNEERHLLTITGTVLSGVGCSLLAALLFRIIMLDSLKNEISSENAIDIMEKSILGLSVDGVILDSKTNFDFAVRMIEEALDAGKEIIEGSLTSDEYFVGNGDSGNFNRAIDGIITKKAKTKHGRRRLENYYKIYKSLQVEEKASETTEIRQNTFNDAVTTWKNSGINVSEYKNLCTDFLLIKNNGKAEKALVGVFFDEHQKQNDVGWLALYLTSGKPLEKIYLLAHHYQIEAFKNNC